MPIEIQRQHRTFSTYARLLLALAAGSAGLLFAVPAAQAATYCVGSPANCSGIDTPGDGAGLQEALNEASANGETDSVWIGPGTYSPPEPGGFVVTSPAHSIVIRGSGSDRTTLEGRGPSAVTLNFTGAAGDSSTVRNISLALSDDGGTPIGLLMAGAGTTSVVVRAPAGVTAGLGVRLGWQASLESTKVITPGLTGVETLADATVAGSLIAGDVGVTAETGQLSVHNSRIEGTHAGILSNVPAAIRSTLVHITGGDGTEIGVAANSAMTATQLTVVGTGTPGYGVRAYRHGGGSASLTLANSIVSGFEHDLSAGADPLSLASITASYSNYASKLASSGGAVNEGAGNLDGDPGFVDPARSDFHLRHDSPLIDIGDDIVMSDELDVDEEQRVVDGDGIDGPRADLGAHEYQRRAPVAVISAPDTATAGEAVELSGSASSDPDRGDALTYSWTFGDGAAAVGATASHAYTGAGTYSVTLVVTDPTGRQATVSKQISVHAPAAGVGAAAGGTGAGSAGPDTIAPVIGRLRTARRGRAIRFRLSETARVTLRLRRAGSRHAVRRIRVNGRMGANEVRLSGRLVRALEPGRYRVKATARDAAGNLAHPRVARLVLLRRAG